MLRRGCGRFCLFKNLIYCDLSCKVVFRIRQFIGVLTVFDCLGESLIFHCLVKYFVDLGEVFFVFSDMQFDSGRVARHSNLLEPGKQPVVDQVPSYTKRRKP